ncbi:phosphoribosylglycinamide formyltransferase [Gloeocapsa sp. PCC 73106]|uniref:phosphoribosylglycinamide formyltransferase n=1 Tax=Gloeocapsa sp. PCC 73106 TaxID=102232 RepID=UPI0002AC665C|nr:phosphoribosylglycinamide formyltransferase [Gloeocapsa sp. PCC 73106]ELR98696.1 phosphoribosylglycinamide formyltransferase, formyltetrahydrofolate-dependent [Gloeocapsa sp. PCC 73106]
MNNVSNSRLISPPLSELTKKSGKPLKLAVLASGQGSNFEAIAQSIDSGQLNAQVAIVIYNNPEAQVSERAQNWQVPSLLINHRDFSRREDFDQAIVESLQRAEIDWVIMAGWMRIVTTVLLNAFTDRIINIHPSLLPSFPGIRAVEQALAAGVKITGCTVHLATLAVDSGPILIQAAVPVFPEDTPATLHARIQIQEHLILPQAIAFCSENLL